MSYYLSESSRKMVIERASNRCEYCQLHQMNAFHKHQIEHIIALKHGGSSDLGNLALACTHCNFHKGTDLSTMLLPNRELVPLFNPRAHRWDEHFYMEDCVFYAKSKIGEATIKVLKMNDVDLIIFRQML
ncbi:MAG: HNH endonuclease [Spirosomaceae bacterium]|jgi:hypothetical protein|nr:HNH endonuclease [Spirosomataceae bacterium]